MFMTSCKRPETKVRGGTMCQCSQTQDLNTKTSVSSVINHRPAHMCVSLQEITNKLEMKMKVTMRWRRPQTPPTKLSVLGRRYYVCFKRRVVKAPLLACNHCLLPT